MQIRNVLRLFLALSPVLAIFFIPDNFKPFQKWKAGSYSLLYGSANYHQPIKAATAQTFALFQEKRSFTILSKTGILNMADATHSAIPLPCRVSSAILT